ncbi:MAG: acyl-CoA dehydrogenase C-terminal domain-containing protein, partial [Rubrivivax sp.]
GHVVLAWLWLDVALVCQRVLGTSADDAAMQGKLAAMRYFFAYELPKVDAWLLAVASRQGVCRDMQDGWF